jgi:2-polyprenyl-6-methoxyphenol hydroxylase-like FAD-dependent oxidoreductase
MNVTIVGAGPAGLYFSYLYKRRRPEARIRLLEQNPADATFGFGVVFSDRALEFLRGDDPETYDLITPKMESWPDIALDLGGETVRIDGIGFSAVGRLELLRLLRARAESVGIWVEYEHAVASLEELSGADLLVGADGVGSLVRQADAAGFGASVTLLKNKFIWYGTRKRFESLTQIFRRGEHGAFTAHHYRYSPEMSTFIVETDVSSWARAGFAAMSAVDTKAYCERLFADSLGGHALVSNKSSWRNFPRVRNERWSVGNRVLLGDALHTAHFSIGSGTRLAMEDAIALDAALDRHPRDIREALASYQSARRPVLEKLVAAADKSAAWYERFGEHMNLAPMDFAMSYITRSGRIDPERLRRTSPGFMSAYEAAGRRVPSGASRG